MTEIDAEINPKLEEIGLTNFGWFTNILDVGEGNKSEVACLLISSHGPQMWRYFSKSAEYMDGKEEPLNRWTESHIHQLVQRSSVKKQVTQICLPFGIKIYPFQQWATLATGCEASPLGIFIDPEFGLWWALRAAICFEDQSLVDAVKIEKSQCPKPEHPCNTCLEKPCINGCPVDAFTASSPIPANEEIDAHTNDHPLLILNSEKCVSHLEADVHPKCMEHGCRARLACPVGRKYRYHPEQIAFHMQSFRRG